MLWEWLRTNASIVYALPAFAQHSCWLSGKKEKQHIADGQLCPLYRRFRNRNLIHSRSPFMSSFICILAFIFFL
ncbi:hypothetical protein E6C60_0485 [Paenibacillus algicola]|uniref:Uncharacterized protein n=1 Tax=Paenibacillus algicola TaxID=2565926 RepID=A0A4P8XG75_9BACL|nr:hypothetical protein E6C60_0485 [Paenibacillus algicola]